MGFGSKVCIVRVSRFGGVGFRVWGVGFRVYGLGCRV